MTEDALVGTVVAGRYAVLRRLARGGMGSLYLVRHVDLDREFVLKTLNPSLAGNAEAFARLRREAKVIASLRHRNVVEVVDWTTLEDNTPCMILEYLPGEDLANRIEREAPLPWPVIRRIADQALSAVSAAHRAGVVHRDLKPANIFLARDESGEELVKLLDFGVSKVQHATSVLTAEFDVLGTPLYMSPEQANGRAQDVGPAADIFAMGSILYEMAAKQPAFIGPTAMMVLYRICSEQPDPLRQHRADAPAEFVAAVEKALMKTPAERYPTIDALRKALQSALARVPATVPKVTPSMVITTKAARPTAAQPRSRWWPGIVLAIAAIGAVATAGYFVFARRQPMPRAERPGAPLTPPTLSPSLSSVTPHCEVHVHRTPPTARLTLDGISVAGDTLRFDTDRKVHTLRVTAPGFGEQELTLDAHSPGDLSVVLQPLTAAVKKPAHHNAKNPEPPSADFDRLTPAFAKPDDRRK